MKVNHAVSAYVAYKQSLGMRFATEARTLKSFSKYVGDVDFNRVGPERRVAGKIDGARIQDGVGGG